MSGDKGLFVLFGPAGRWKTTEALKTFQDALYLASDAGLDKFYRQWLLTDEGRASGKKPPVETVVLGQYSINGKPVQRDKQGNMIRIPQKHNFERAIENMIITLSDAVAVARPLPFRNVIIDEGTVFWERFLIEMQREMITGRDVFGNACEKNANGKAHHGRLQTWTREVIDRVMTLLQFGANIVLIHHLVEPDGDRKGGPQAPNARITNILGGAAHASLLSDFEEPASSLMAEGPKEQAKHVWLVTQSKEWVSKFRGIPAERFDEVKYWPLEDIVRLGGFEP